MQNFIIISILSLIAGAVIAFLVLSKRRGKGCVGCPYAKQCKGCCEAKTKLNGKNSA